MRDCTQLTCHIGGSLPSIKLPGLIRHVIEYAHGKHVSTNAAVRRHKKSSVSVSLTGQVGLTATHMLGTAHIAAYMHARHVDIQTLTQWHKGTRWVRLGLCACVMANLMQNRRFGAMFDSHETTAPDPVLAMET